MKNVDKNAYIKYRLEKAVETYDVALLLFDNSKWNSTINRLYYSCFYAVSALLVKQGINATSHSGIKSMFFLNYVKNKKISIEFGKLYSDLFDWRQKGDYGDFFDFKEEDVKPLMKPTKELIDKIEDTINRTEH